MSKEKIVWHLCSNRWNSAITEYALRSAQALKLIGWHSEISALPSSHCARRAQEYGVDGPSFRFRVTDIFRVRAYAQRLNPTVILTYGGPETFLARFLGIPVVRFRGQDRDLTEPLSAFSLRWNLGFCQAILTPAERVRDRFRSLLPHKAVEAILLGLDSRIFHARKGVAPRPTLLIVGRLDPIKGHAPFLAMFSQLLRDLPREDPQPFLEIIGQSSNMSAAALHQTACDLGLVRGQDYEIIDERVRDLPERMARVHLGIVPSLGSEVIGRVTEEFLLSGIPVLIAPVGTLPECLAHDSFGAILSLETLKEWLAQVRHESFEDRLRRSEKARAHFSLESMGESLAAFLYQTKR